MKVFLFLVLMGCVTALKPENHEWLEGRRTKGDLLIYERHFLHIEPGYNLTEHFRYPEHKNPLYYYKLTRLEIRDYPNTVIFQGLDGGTGLLNVAYDFITPWGKTLNVSVKLWGIFIGACGKSQ